MDKNLNLTILAFCGKKNFVVTELTKNKIAHTNFWCQTRADFNSKRKAKQDKKNIFSAVFPPGVTNLSWPASQALITDSRNNNSFWRWKFFSRAANFSQLFHNKKVDGKGWEVYPNQFGRCCWFWIRG